MTNMNPSMTVSRRHILKSATRFAASAALPTWFLDRQVRSIHAAERSPNERLHFALIGCGGRGMSIAKEAQMFGDLVALCDVDAAHLDRAQERYKNANIYSDFRKVCDLANVDAIINATPDHWHTLINLRAVKS